MTDSETLHIRRLLVALDAMRCGAGDWTAAMDLAELFGVELQGLFVQDVDLLGLALLPIAHEVGRVSGQARPLARESVESALKRRVERTASELERAGKMRNVAVTYTTARGKLVRQALERGEHGDVVFFAARNPSREGARTRTRGRVMLWYDAGPTAQQSSELALQLVRRTGAELLIGFPAERFPSEAELRVSLQRLLAWAPHRVQLNAFPDARVESILDVARNARIAHMVLGAEGPLTSVEALEYLCAGFSGELILVR